MPDHHVVARLHDLRLRTEAATYSTQLAGRIRSAQRLDELFHAIVGAVEPDLFLEVGARDAEASVRVRQSGSAPVVVACEADPRAATAERIREFAAMGIDYRHVAVAGHQGTTEIRIDQANLAPSLLRRRDAGEQTVVEVPCDTMDNLSADAARIAAWIDVEGAAGAVLAEAGSALERTAVLKVEVEDFASWEGQEIAIDVIERLVSHGLIPIARDVEYDGQYNLVAVSDAALRGWGVQTALAQHQYALAHTLSRDPSPLRANPTLRAIARPVRRNLSRLRAGAAERLQR